MTRAVAGTIKMVNQNPKPPWGKRNAAKPQEQHKRQTSITLSPEAMAKVKRLAEAAGCNVSQVIEKLIMKAKD